MASNSKPFGAIQYKYNLSSKDGVYNPDLAYSSKFKLSLVFDCGKQMKIHSGSTDYHSLMHDVQKPILVSSQVEEISFFADKSKLSQWTKDIIPTQKVFGCSSSLRKPSEIKRLFEIISERIDYLDDFIIKPSNGSESIGVLKVILGPKGLEAQFLGEKKENSKSYNPLSIITDFKKFKAWINEEILNVTSGNIDTHLRHIEPGIIIQDLFPHEKKELGPVEMKFFTAWGEILFVGCRNGEDICFGHNGEFLEGERANAKILYDSFFNELKDVALALARASTFPNLRCDFFVDPESGNWVLNEVETLADCRTYPNYLLKNTGEFYLKGWLDKKYQITNSPLTTPLLRERFMTEMGITIGEI